MTSMITAKWKCKWKTKCRRLRHAHEARTALREWLML